jgi:hypothetical protein
MIRNVSLVNGQTDRLALPYGTAYTIRIMILFSKLLNYRYENRYFFPKLSNNYSNSEMSTIAQAYRLRINHMYIYFVSTKSWRDDPAAT